MKNATRIFSMGITFCVMFLFWLLFSAWTIYIPQHYDMVQVSKGILAALIVALLTHDIFIPHRGEKLLLKSERFIAYAAWELWQIYLATIDVAKRVLGILPIDPRIIEFETTLRSDLALTAFGNSITLTPGTITIDVKPERGMFMVHAIAKEPADSLTVDQTMQKKVAYVFFEEELEGEAS
jgi:multicomponent Na+:H+ antiporter subunit E